MSNDKQIKDNEINNKRKEKNIFSKDFRQKRRERKFNFTNIKNKIHEESKIKNMHNKKKDKDNDEKDKTFLDVLITTIKHIFWYEFIIFAGLFLSWAIYTFNTFAALLVGTFICIDNLIPHWFSNSMYQYIFFFIFITKKINNNLIFF